jgi:hypothetical protein
MRRDRTILREPNHGDTHPGDPLQRALRGGRKTAAMSADTDHARDATCLLRSRGTQQHFEFRGPISGRVARRPGGAVKYRDCGFDRSDASDSTGEKEERYQDTARKIVRGSRMYQRRCGVHTLLVACSMPARALGP